MSHPTTQRRGPIHLRLPPDLPDHYQLVEQGREWPLCLVWAPPRLTRRRLRQEWPRWLVWCSGLLVGYVIGAITIFPLLHFLAPWGWLVP